MMPGPKEEPDKRLETDGKIHEFYMRHFDVEGGEAHCDVCSLNDAGCMGATHTHCDIHDEFDTDGYLTKGGLYREIDPLYYDLLEAKEADDGTD